MGSGPLRVGWATYMAWTKRQGKKADWQAANVMVQLTAALEQLPIVPPTTDITSLE